MKYIWVFIFLLLVGCTGEMSGIQNCDGQVNHDWSHWSNPRNIDSVLATQTKTCSVCNKVIQRQLNR